MKTVPAEQLLTEDIHVIKANAFLVKIKINQNLSLSQLIARLLQNSSNGRTYRKDIEWVFTSALQVNKWDLIATVIHIVEHLQKSAILTPA